MSAGYVENLVCIELPGQVNRAFESLKSRGATQHTILALTPHVEYELEKMGHPYVRPEDYHTEDAIHAVGLKDLSTLEQFCAVLDGFFHQRSELLRQHDIRPADLNWYYLKILFNSVSIRAFILKKIFAAEQPEKVFYFDTQAEALARHLFFVRESVWSRIIPVACDSMNIPRDSLGRETDPSVLNQCPGTSRGGKEEIKHLGRKVLGPGGIRRLKSVRSRLRFTSQKFLASPNSRDQQKRPNLLFLERSYSLGHLLQHVESHGDFNPWYWDVLDSPSAPQPEKPVASENGSGAVDPGRKSLLHQQSAKLWQEARTLPELRHLLHFSSIDCFPVMESRLRRFFEIDVTEMVLTYFEARSFLSAAPPTAVLAATMGDYGNRAVALAANIEQVPFIVYRHGESAGHVLMETGISAMNEHNDLRMSDYVLALGQGDVEFFEKNRKTPVQSIPVGSASLDHLKKSLSSSSREGLLRKYGLDPGKRTVMYVPTLMDGSIRVAPYRNRSPSIMFGLERRIIEVFGEFPNIQLVVKLQTSPFYPCSPTAQIVRENRLENCVVITEPFSQVVSMADLFATDYPATTFLEMLVTDKPILICGYQFPRPWLPGKWHPSVLEMYRERVEYSEDLPGFLDLLRNYLREGQFQPVKSNDSLLKLFGTHLNDGKSVDRAYAFLESLVKLQMNQNTDSPASRERSCT